MLSAEPAVLAAARRPHAAAVRRALRTRLLAIALAALGVGVPLVYLLAVRTHAGQAFENAALDGARRHATGTWYADADHWLDRITAASFGFSLLAIAAVGVLRRRWALAFCGVGTAFAAVLTSRILKSVLPQRPELGVPVRPDEAHNSFPSGHATAAMALFFAVLIVVSRRWYLPATLVALPGAVGSGVATVAANWHRLSDTLGADLVALAAGTAGLAVVVQFGLAGPALRRASAPQRWLTGGILAAAAVAFALGLTYYLRYRHAVGAAAQQDAYWSSQSFALGGALAAAAVMLGVCLSVVASPQRDSLLR